MLALSELQSGLDFFALGCLRELNLIGINSELFFLIYLFWDFTSFLLLKIFLIKNLHFYSISYNSLVCPYDKFCDYFLIMSLFPDYTNYTLSSSACPPFI